VETVVAGQCLSFLGGVFLQAWLESSTHTPAVANSQGCIFPVLVWCGLNTSSSLLPTQIAYNNGNEFNFQCELIYAKTAFSIIRWGVFII
jgi:hypothetical protein